MGIPWLLDGTNFLLSSKNKSMVIYGLGENTKHVIDAFPEYHILGVMDEAHTGDCIFGKPVLDIQDAASLKIDVIIIIARAANVPIIYHRIARLCKEFKIPVFDINGEELVLQEKNLSDGSPLAGEKKEDLYNKIDQCQIISFDIFDTLIMRKVLIPTDIFMMVETKIKDRGFKFPFFRERRKAEMELLGEGVHPQLKDIYDRMAERCPSYSGYQREWMELELKTEQEYLMARDDMKEVLDYIRRAGKQLVFVSDMYLPDTILSDLLKTVGIHVEAEQLIVSCQYGRSKNSGLHSILRERFPGEKILHVGDNAEADGKCAKEAGIDDVFLVNSAYAMLDKSRANGLLQFCDAFENRKVLGDFAAKQFSSPFVFEKTGGKICIDTDFDIGYYFLAPILEVFIDWLIGKCNERKLAKILLSSRDGYIIKELLDLVSKTNPSLKLPEYIYFYTSRAVCVRAAVKEEKDIMYAAGQIPFSGTAEMMLEKRFGLRKRDLLRRQKGESDIEYIMRHKKKILQYAYEARTCYETYLLTLGIHKTDKCGFFDFVSGGTSQYALSRFWNIEFTGLYFLKFFDPAKSELSIEALFQEHNIYVKGSALEAQYFLLERVITSFEPTLAGFDEKGRPLFEKETRSQEELKSLQEIQDGVLEAFRRYHVTDKSMADEFIRLMSKEYAVCMLPFLRSMHMNDEFCNRSFEIPGF